jgi:hypothetical protein
VVLRVLKLTLFDSQLTKAMKIRIYELEELKKKKDVSFSLHMCN